MTSTGHVNRVPLPFGFLLTVAYRTRPWGLGVVFWTPGQYAAKRQERERS